MIPERTVAMRVNPDGSPLVDVVTVHTDHPMAQWPTGRWVTESDRDFMLFEYGDIIPTGYLLRRTEPPEQSVVELVIWLARD